MSAPRFSCVLCARDFARGRVASQIDLICVFCAAVSFLVLLWILDIFVPAYDTGTHITYAGSPFTHFFHMVNYATLLKSEPGKPGIFSRLLEPAKSESAMADTLENKVVDRRVVQRYLRKGLLDEKDYEQYLKKLPDVGDRAVPIESEIEHVETDADDKEP